MIVPGAPAVAFELPSLDGGPIRLSPDGDGPTLLAFVEADCPTCQLTLPYLDRLARRVEPGGGQVLIISQDGPDATRGLLSQAGAKLPAALDSELVVSRRFDPPSVPALVLLDARLKVLATVVGFEKRGLNALAERMLSAVGLPPVEIAPAGDGAPEARPGCASRHREPAAVGEPKPAAQAAAYRRRAPRASRVEVPDGADPYEFCRQMGFGDPLPVVLPTVERVERMLAAAELPPDEVIGLVPPNYGAATVEKIAANAVMAGCAPEMMRVLIPVVRAVCDERFDAHGMQATTHFAAPLVIVNGPVRRELGFVSGGNVFSNVARANSTLGRALQLILTNLGGARPGEIDMSTLGNPGKFSFCIAENEEASPWPPFHVEAGFRPDQSAVSLFACEAPHGVSEHNARDGRQVLRAVSRALATVWTYRACGPFEALVVIGPEHARTIAASGMSKAAARQFLYDQTGIPTRHFDAEGVEGTAYVGAAEVITIDGEACYRKFPRPEAIKLLVAGGSAGKFSAVLGSWLAGPRGSRMVTYPVA